MFFCEVGIIIPTYLIGLLRLKVFENCRVRSAPKGTLPAKPCVEDFDNDDMETQRLEQDWRAQIASDSVNILTSILYLIKEKQLRGHTK